MCLLLDNQWCIILIRNRDFNGDRNYWVRLRHCTLTFFECIIISSSFHVSISSKFNLLMTKNCALLHL